MVSQLFGDFFRSREPVVHPAGRNRPWKVGLLSPRSWAGRLFVDSHAHRRVDPWRCRRIQVPVSVPGEFVVSARRIIGPFEPLCAHSSLSSEDRLLFFRKAQVVGPSRGVIVRSCELSFSVSTVYVVSSPGFPSWLPK